MADREDCPSTRLPYASWIDEDGRVQLPAPLRDLTGLEAGMDVTLSEGRDGFVVNLPAKLATDEDIASWLSEPPPTLREGSEERIQHLLSCWVSDGSLDEHGFDFLTLAVGTRTEDLKAAFGCEVRGQDQSPAG